MSLGLEKHGRLVVVATRDIAAYEQLSVDYGWYFDPATLEEVRNEAAKAYNEDLSHLQADFSLKRQRFSWKCDEIKSFSTKKTKEFIRIK